ncbi:hypothetical protein Goari_006231, partial [Gossypium aridum]|nr:hypothetical protein [Gossypium aridum]
MIAAAGDALWKNGAVCGKKFTVKCTGPRNGCPGCPSTMDLSREAFEIIAKPVAGIINMDYK